MDDPTTGKLRILVANELDERVGAVRDAVASLGHDVVVTSNDASAVAELTADVVPDVALVGLAGTSRETLASINTLVREAACPVIVLLAGQDPAFVREAARCGVFAYLVDDGQEQLESALEIVLRRFAEYHDLEGAFGRRAVTERAKGMLMERHGVDEQQAFELLRDHARRRGRRVVDIAQGICDSHLLLPRAPDDAPPQR